MPDAHTHTDVEFNFVLRGEMRYFLGGAFESVEPARLVVFWAGRPHRLVQVAAGTEFLGATLPLAWFLSWRLPEAFTQALLRGALLKHPTNVACAVGAVTDFDDAALLSRWTRDLGPLPAEQAAEERQSREAQRVVLLEAEARLRRLAMTLRDVPVSTAAGAGAGGAESGGHVEQLARYLSEHYQEPVTVEQAARAAGLHPHYAMTLFKQGCGMSLWEYLVRLRVSHAQRLLLTTDWTVQRVAGECGFGSPGRFFVAFRRVCGCTPRAYRNCRSPGSVLY